MRQNVTVVRLLDQNRAEVRCFRESACSGDCHKCAGCGAAAETVVVAAENLIGAEPGDRVVVESSTRSVLAASAVAYLLPLALFFGGYGLGAALDLLPALIGGLGFFLGLLGTFWYGRRLERRKTVQYKITGFAGN